MVQWLKSAYSRLLDLIEEYSFCILKGLSVDASYGDGDATNGGNETAVAGYADAIAFEAGEDA